jgi:tungstate transport system ATP-binding protein
MLYALNHLKKSYDGRTVLDLGIVSLERAKVLGLLGPNGAGKTTLLKILAFLVPPTSGEMWFEEKRVDFHRDNLIDLRRRVVLVQQQPILFTATVSKNVEFPLRRRKIPKARRGGIVDEFLELVGMGAFRQAKAHKLSAGETQRVAIARALACYPEVILLDEPTANVDVENRVSIERIIQEINREKGISILFATHNMIQASRLADETIFLFEGKVSRSIYENIFSGHIETDAKGVKTCHLQGGLKLRLPTEKSGAVRISIDPSAVKISQSESDISRENTFKGRLIQLTDEQSRVRALVDVGIPLSVLIPKEVSKGKQLSMGEEVWLTCPVEGIEVF